MKFSLLHESDGRRTFMVVLSSGDEAVECLSAFAREHELHADDAGLLPEVEPMHAERHGLW